MEPYPGGEGRGTLGVLIMFYSGLGLWLHKDVHFVKFIGLGTCNYILFCLVFQQNGLRICDTKFPCSFCSSTGNSPPYFFSCSYSPKGSCRAVGSLAILTGFAVVTTRGVMRDPEEHLVDGWAWSRTHPVTLSLLPSQISSSRLLR